MFRILAATLLACTLSFGEALAADVTLRAEDGTRIHASYDAVNGAKHGVVLVHMLGRSAEDWRFVTKKLNEAGITTLAVDLRGHGANVPEGKEAPALTETDYRAMTQDVAAGVAHLRKQGVEQVSIVGASIGANLALQVASKDKAILDVVLLSPGANYKGVVVAPDNMADYGDRPILLVASKDDRVAAKTAYLLDKAAVGDHKLMLFDTAGHGTKMLNKEPSLEPDLISWLLGTDRLSSTEAGSVSSSADIKTGDTTAIETKGEKLGSHQ